jgi:hypothetical protein
LLPRPQRSRGHGQAAPCFHLDKRHQAILLSDGIDFPCLGTHSPPENAPSPRCQCVTGTLLSLHANTKIRHPRESFGQGFLNKRSHRIDWLTIFEGSRRI